MSWDQAIEDLKPPGVRFPVYGRNGLKKSGTGLWRRCVECHSLYAIRGRRIRYCPKCVPSVEQRRAFVDRLKEKPCTDCGYSFHPVAMQFDHLDPSQKVASVSALVGRCVPLSAVLAEIAKCELVCANCHAIREHKRRHNRSKRPGQNGAA